MWHPTLIKARTSPLLLGALVATGLLFAGCDERVDVVRDHSVIIPKHATWAWRPDTAEKKIKIKTQPLATLFRVTLFLMTDALRLSRAIPVQIMKLYGWQSARI